MFEQYYVVMYYRNEKWQCFGGWDNPVKTYNPFNAKALAEEVANIEGSQATMAMKVTVAPFQDVVTRAMHTQTTYEGLV